MLERTATGAEIQPCPELQTACNGLEWFLPDVLREAAPESWKWESLDGVLPIRATKSGEREVDLFASAILISDQTVTLLHARFQIDGIGKSIPWLELRLGERTDGHWLREKYGEEKNIIRRLSRRNWDIHAVDWYLEVGYGERNS